MTNYDPDISKTNVVALLNNGANLNYTKSGFVPKHFYENPNEKIPSVNRSMMKIIEKA